MKFPGVIRSKLPKQGTTIFTVMSALAREHGAVNLSQGFPDFSIPERLVELTHANMQRGLNQYSPMQGVLSLREKLAEKVKELYSAEYDPETEVNITAGATQAIYTAIAAFVNEGDEVIIFEPAYDCYVPAIEIHGGKAMYIQMNLSGELIDWEKVKRLINQRTRMIIINTPHNPSGRVMTAADMMKLQKLTDNTDIIVLSDEVYEHIIFDGLEHQSVARYPKLAERSIIVSSFGKTYHNTGWKMGYVLAPAELMKEFRKVHQFNVFSVNTPVQHALADFLNEKEHYLQLAAFYQQKRNTFQELLKGSRFKLRPSEGTYFQLLDYSDISDEKDTDFAVRLTKDTGVAAIPVSVFYHQKNEDRFLRFCFAKEDETLEKAAEKLIKL
ncbi:MAG: aminotransferase class I/II-fold pyridoxal phosphate-dependent enzyme [Bacteroidetes bacterium]|nr:MAG: aminotransferase class I/II-fold pyridoxal phosphate-dependent enzyme [Bacteroidota bacterium]